MYTGNVWFVALVAAGFLAALISFQLLLAAVFRTWADRASEALRRRPVASPLTGVGALAVVIAVAAVLGQLGGPGKFLSAVVVTASAFPLVLGLAAVSRFVGERMPSPTDAGRPWRAMLRGGVTTSLAFVMPIVGWFVLFPAAMVVGLGAAVLGALARSRHPIETPPMPREALAREPAGLVA